MYYGQDRSPSDWSKLVDDWSRKINLFIAETPLEYGGDLKIKIPFDIEYYRAVDIAQMLVREYSKVWGSVSFTYVMHGFWKKFFLRKRVIGDGYIIFTFTKIYQGG